MSVEDINMDELDYLTEEVFKKWKTSNFTMSEPILRKVVEQAAKELEEKRDLK